MGVQAPRGLECGIARISRKAARKKYLSGAVANIEKDPCPLDSRFEGLFDTVFDGLILADHNGRILGLNRAARKIFGYTKHEAEGSPIGILVPELNRASWKDCAESHIAMGRAGNFINIGTQELQGRRKDGSGFPVALAMAPMPSAGPRQFVVTVRCVGTGKGREHVPSESEQRPQVGTDYLPILVCYVGPDGRYRSCNKAHQHWFGLSPDRIIGRHMREVWGEQAERIARTHFDAALAGWPSGIETKLPFKYGGSRYVNSLYAPHAVGGGAVAGCHVLTTDLTEHRRKKAELCNIRKTISPGPLTSGIVHLSTDLLGFLAITLEAHGDGESERSDTGLSTSGCRSPAPDVV